MRPAVSLLVLVAACGNAGTRPLQPASVTPILLFNGKGTSAEDVLAVESVLDSARFRYATVNSSQLNSMNESELATYRLLIVPGGNFEIIGDHLTSEAMAAVHGAVHGGLNYLGVCAGAFLAGHNRYYDKSFDLASGDFDFYSAESQGIRKAALAISSPGAPSIQQYWEDGPALTGWGAVVARYPDGTPAVTEGVSGRGWVILSGVHPEAPPKWRRGLTFSTPIEVDHAYAARLIEAALNRQSLPHD